MTRKSPAANDARASDCKPFAGTVLIIAPHMDDEALACGGLMARLPQKHRVFIVFASDGMKSPAPVLQWRDAITPDLGALRQNESRAAADVLGVPRHNLHFLGLPESQLKRHRTELARLLLQRIQSIDPDHVLVPFRYDRHPDHIAVNHAVTDAKRQGTMRATLSEYFVYHRWRLLPRGDIRQYLRPDHLIRIDISDVAARKRAALACFTTQTTCYYAWQTRPILRPELLDEECAGPELFLRYDPSAPGAQVFTDTVLWIRIAHRLEPLLVKWKYLLRSSVLRAFGRHE